jgi:hypothetical protein
MRPKLQKQSVLKLAGRMIPQSSGIERYLLDIDCIMLRMFLYLKSNIFEHIELI